MTNYYNFAKTILSQLTGSKEAKYYLERYQNHEKKFAVVKVGGQVIADELNQLSDALALLAHLGLTPIVLHGGGVQIDQAMNEHNIEPKKIHGLRVTDSQSMSLIEKEMKTISLSLINGLKQKGIEACSVDSSTFQCDFLDSKTYGFVGDIQSVNTQQLQCHLDQGVIPIVSCLGQSNCGHTLNINADVAVRELVLKIKPHKTLFVTPTGGILNGLGQLIPAIQLEHDYQHLMQQNWLHSGMKLKLQQINELLSSSHEKSSISITCSKNLVKELFTHKGSGTFIIKGERFHEFTTILPSLQTKLTQLLESSFQQKLKPDFFHNLNIEKIYLSSSHRALAIICKGYGGTSYLHKFAVTPQAQGEGLAASLWRVIQSHHSQLYWRSRDNNPINSWYLKKADTVVRQPSPNSHWLGFSYGLPLLQAQECIRSSFHHCPGWEHQNSLNHQEEHYV
jgi:acetylglutamate kinase